MVRIAPNQGSPILDFSPKEIEILCPVRIHQETIAEKMTRPEASRPKIQEWGETKGQLIFNLLLQPARYPKVRRGRKFLGGALLTGKNLY
jgi:hypothetical protein